MNIYPICENLLETFIPRYLESNQTTVVISLRVLRLFILQIKLLFPFVLAVYL